MSKGSTKRRSSGSSRARKRRSDGVNWIYIIGGIGLAALVIGLVINVSRQLVPIEGLQTFAALPGGQHVSTPVDYPQTPPVGGAHYNSWQNCGIYDEEVEDEYAVHSMEHGAVWIAYQPDLPASEVEALRNQVRGRGYLLMAPYPELDTPIALSAWGAQLKLDQASDERIGQFINKYRQGPQTPEPNAICTNGIGSPLER